MSDKGTNLLVLADPKPPAAVDYTEKSIQSLEKLAHIRLRPTGYITDTSVGGQVHIAKEVLDNCLDELIREILTGIISITLCRDVQNNTYQMIIRDNGRGIPIGSLMNSFTKLHTSGKYNTESYKFSSGSFGIGAKATAGLSRNLRAITLRPDGLGSITVNQGIPCEETDIDRKNIPKETGTVVIYEPDPLIFTDIETFGESGFKELITLLQKYCFFKPYNITFRIHQSGIPKAFWSAPTKEAIELISYYESEAHVVFSEQTFDRQAWIRHYWNLSRPFAWTYTCGDNLQTPEGAAIEYQAYLYYVKFENFGNRFGMVNNVPIDDQKSSHLVAISEILKLRIATLIKDNAIRKFFLEDYRLPLFIGADVKFEGAQFTGTTKHAFTSKKFRESYDRSLMSNMLAKPVDLQVLFELMWEDIESKYNAQIGNIAKSKDLNRLFTELKFPLNFVDCNTDNRKTAELFIMEGGSASGKQGRDPERHALYALRGKPLNAITGPNNVATIRTDLQKDPIYHDIIKISGVNPSKFSIDDLNFGGIFICTDSDSDGYHIAEIVLSNLSILCPDMVAAGVIHIVTPPLYGIKIGKKLKIPAEYVFFRDEQELVSWYTNSIYMPAIDIGIRADGCFDKIRQLNKQEYESLALWILEIGDMITNIANELVLDPQTVEALSFVTQHIEPGYVDVAAIQRDLGIPNVSYSPDGDILVIPYGKEDIIIPLARVRESLYEKITPLMNALAWKKLEIYITSKHSNNYKNSRVSFMQLYSILKMLDGMFEIERYKGLGQMLPEERYRTCMDPQYRTTYQVTSIGDLDIIFNLLGKDSIHRKRALTKI